MVRRRHCRRINSAGKALATRLACSLVYLTLDTSSCFWLKGFSESPGLCFETYYEFLEEYAMLAPSAMDLVLLVGSRPHPVMSAKKSVESVATPFLRSLVSESQWWTFYIIFFKHYNVATLLRVQHISSSSPTMPAKTLHLRCEQMTMPQMVHVVHSQATESKVLISLSFTLAVPVWSTSHAAML